MSSKNKRLARQIALQALYELDCTRHPVAEVMTARFEEDPVDDDLRLFAQRVVNGVLAHSERLDAVIQRYAPEWPLVQMAIIDRNILRIAIFEFAILKETPIKVAINEAIEMAKNFGSESASRFVNGVLGTLASRQAELEEVLSDLKA